MLTKFGHFERITRLSITQFNQECAIRVVRAREKPATWISNNFTVKQTCARRIKKKSMYIRATDVGVVIRKFETK